MSEALQKKLRITPGTNICTVNAPTGYAKTLGKLPTGARITEGVTKGHAFIHLFAQDKAALDKAFPKCAKALAPDGLLWISYPKGGKDLTRDKGWEVLEGVTMRWLSLVSFDGTWSAFLMQNSAPQAQSRASQEYQAHSATWVDAASKTVTVPDDLAAALKKSAQAKATFEMLSFTNRKEYVLWIVGAKREGTRIDRVKNSIEKLVAGKKNPSEK